MSLNDDQKDYVESLAKLPPEEVCDCGWYRIEECKCDDAKKYDEARRARNRSINHLRKGVARIDELIVQVASQRDEIDHWKNKYEAAERNWSDEVLDLQDCQKNQDAIIDHQYDDNAKLTAQIGQYQNALAELISLAEDGGVRVATVMERNNIDLATLQTKDADEVCERLVEDAVGKPPIHKMSGKDTPTPQSKSQERRFAHQLKGRETADDLYADIMDPAVKEIDRLGGYELDED